MNIQIPDHSGFHVKEVFSDNEFPRITDAPYTVTLTPHTFYWFSLERPVEPARSEVERGFDIQADATWDQILDSTAVPQMLTACGRISATPGGSEARARPSARSALRTT